jgi:hypothetical protein
VVAENLLKQLLLLLKRLSRKAPYLTPLERGIMGLCSRLMPPHRLLRPAMVVKPTTLLKFHRALKAWTYRLLFSVVLLFSIFPILDIHAKLKAVDEQADDEVVHLHGLRETNCSSGEALDSRAQREMFAFQLLGHPRADHMLL